MTRLAVVCAALLLPSSTPAQTLGDDDALPPDEREVEAITRAWRERETQRLHAVRHRIWGVVDVGVAVLRYREYVTDTLTLRREDALAPTLALGARYGITPAFELFGRVEVTAPVRVGVIDNTAFTRASATACDGTRRFELAPATAALATLELGFRTRVLTSLSPFFVGVGLRLGVQVSSGSGAWAIQCVDDRGRDTSRIAGESSGEALRMDLGAVLETGYRFGDDERWQLGLRMLVQALGTNDAGLGGAQLALGWAFR